MRLGKCGVGESNGIILRIVQSERWRGEGIALADFRRDVSSAYRSGGVSAMEGQSTCCVCLGG